MLLTLERFYSDTFATLGMLKVNGRFRCFTLEDQYQAGEKVPGKTRIPTGIYDVKLRTEGGFNERYAKRPRIAEIHKGMLWLQHVPNFEYILIHCGNTADDTAGCILVGMQSTLTENGGGGTVQRSVDAYVDVYPEIAAALLSDQFVTIEVLDRDLPANR